MNTLPPTIYLVDDDPAITRAAGHLLMASGFAVRSYQSSAEFLNAYDPEVPGCVVLDMVMPEMDGLAVQRLLQGRGAIHPIIFLTGEGCVSNAVEALKAGAVDFLAKPFDGEVLVAAVHAAVQRDSIARSSHRQKRLDISRFSVLTDREKQILDYIASGWLNKEIASEVGIAERTVKFHRANLMDKLGAGSVTDLVRLTTQLGLVVKPPPQNP